MNGHNPRKRQHSGHNEDVVPVPQDPSFSHSSATIYSPPVDSGFTEWELQVLGHAASILNCTHAQLVALDNNSYRRQTTTTSPIIHHRPPHKRPRHRSDMSPSEKSSSSALSGRERYERPQRDSDNSCFTLGVPASRMARYFANTCAPCLTSEPQDYAAVPDVTSPCDYGPRPPFYSDNPPSSQSQSWSLSSDQAAAGVFAYDQAPASQFMPGYPVLQPSQSGQPMATQPSTRGEGMLYPETSSRAKYLGQSETQQTMNHVTNSQNVDFSPSQCDVAGSDVSRLNSGVGYLPQIGHRVQDAGHQSRNLDIVQPQQRPPPAKRGPFKTNADREKTAETRRIGSCIRCRMQRIRCETNPDDKFGTCLTCSRVTNVKVWRLPCLRYKITDVKLYKPGQVKGYEWSLRWTEGIADDISQWASQEMRTVCVTEGYTNQPVQLRVRQFVPQAGDALERTWVYNGTKRSVTIPPFAIVNIEEVKTIYTRHIKQGSRECCRRIVGGKEKLIAMTYALALKTMTDETISLKERELLKKTIELWMAIRMTTKSTYIVGQETLGMPPNIMDDTSPLPGHIPLPPVMGAQIELVLIHQIQAKLRREMLEELQVMTQANSHSTWMTLYLVTFILLHNVSLLCQHDAGYARKHGFKCKQTRFAREEMVREYQHGANILLAYFHYCNKGIYPFSTECKEQDLSTLANLDTPKMKFVHITRGVAKEQKNHWEKMRQSHDYENDFYYISQLFEENWTPPSTV